eukprot:6091802-Amphidinium_carterae.1
MDMEVPGEESERQAKRQRRLEAVPEDEELPFLEDEVGQVHPEETQVEVSQEDFLEGQWRDWVRRTMTTSDFDWPDEIEGMPEKIRNIMKSIPADVKAECKLVHHQLGHPGRATMLRMAKLAHKGPLHIKFLRHWQCPVCLQRRPPQKLGVASGSERAREFNVELNVDLKFARDVMNRTHVLLNMLAPRQGTVSLLGSRTRAQPQWPGRS